MNSAGRAANHPSGKDPSRTATAIEVFTLLNDRRYSTGSKKRSHVLHVIHSELSRLLGNIPNIGSKDSGKGAFRLIDSKRAETCGSRRRTKLRSSLTPRISRRRQQLRRGVAGGCVHEGWRHFISFNCIGQRYVGCGLGPETGDVTIEVYGSSGDYLGSGIDG